MHTAMVLYLGEKMAKSLGNLIMVSDLLKIHTANEIRWLLLSHHYRKTWEFDESELKKVKEEVSIIAKALKKIEKRAEVANPLYKEFAFIVDDDLNIPAALLFLINLAKRIEKETNEKKASDFRETLLSCLELLGFSF